MRQLFCDASDKCVVLPLPNSMQSLWVDSVVKEHGSTYNTQKGTAGSRLRMQAVRRDSKDQETFTLQCA